MTPHLRVSSNARPGPRFALLSTMEAREGSATLAGVRGPADPLSGSPARGATWRGLDTLPMGAIDLWQIRPLARVDEKSGRIALSSLIPVSMEGTRNA